MKKLQRGLTIVLSIVLLISLGGLLLSYLGYQQGTEDYSAAEDLAGIPQEPQPAPTEPIPSPLPLETETQEETDPYLLELLNTDLASLQDVNGDVLGWIQIPDMEISYPLVQGTDNDYYLHNTWQKKSSSVGAIFADYRNSRDLRDFNTVIYGHNMKNNSMFGQLDQFRDEVFLKEHPYVYLVDGDGSRKYQIFAAYEVSVATAEAYQLSFPQEDDRQAFIDTCQSLSHLDSGVTPAVDSPIITLSTCTGWGYSTRWVVQATLVQEVPRTAE